METAKLSLTAMPSKAERQKVADTLKVVAELDFDEVVILGFKNGSSFLHHSKIEDTPRLIGAIEWIKHRIMEK